MDELSRRYEDRIDRLREALQHIVDGFFGSAVMRSRALEALDEDSKLATRLREDSGAD